MHSLDQVMRDANDFLLIGDSSADRFPGFSYHAYTVAKRRFYCLDLGGLKASRGPTKGGKVYNSVDELPKDELGSLAILWVKPKRSKEAVELAHQAGSTEVWFSFHTAHPSAVERAQELGMTVIEVGRCPVYYLDNAPLACRGHRALVALSGTRRRPPQLSLNKDQRIMF